MNGNGQENSGVNDDDLSASTTIEAGGQLKIEYVIDKPNTVIR